MTRESARALILWAVSDGRVGMENQVLGLGEAIMRRREAGLVVKRVAWKGASGRLPWWLHPFPRATLTSQSGVAPPWPDIWLAAGRATLPLSTALRRWSKGQTFVVQVQAPRAPARLFDLVIPPLHDQLNGPNVFPIIGSPNRIEPGRLATEAARFKALIDPLPHPRVAVLIGGKSKTHDLSHDAARAMARSIEAAIGAAGGSVMATFSRRTPAAAQEILAAGLARLPGVVWNGEGENPYFAFLGGADYILATEDSTNLATEAGSTGAPVYILPMEGGGPKFHRFHQTLQASGVARPFRGVFESWTYPPLAETERAADEILRRFDEARP